MPSDSSLRRKVAGLSASDGGYLLALTYVTSHLDSLINRAAEGGVIAEARIIRAEVLQKLGNLVGCQEELSRVKVVDLTPATSQGYLLIKAKLLMQQGNLMASKVALLSLRDKLGYNGLGDIYQVYLKV